MKLTELQTNVFYVLLISGAFFLICISDANSIKKYKLRLSKSSSISIVTLIPIAASYLLLLYPLANRNCGADTLQYYRTYLSDDTSGLDAVFYYLCKAMHGVIPDPKVGLGIISAVTLFLGYYAIIRMREIVDCRLSFLAFYTCVYFYMYNYMRIMLAVTIIYVGYSCILKGNNKVAYIWFFLAVLFHRSAIVVLLIYFVGQHFKKHRKLMIGLGLIGLVVFMERPFFFLSLIQIERYSALIEYQNQTVGFGTTVIILPFIYILYLYRNKINNQIIYNAAVYFTFANFAFAFLGYFVDSASRLSNMYFLFHNIFFVPYIIRSEEQNTRKRRQLIIFLILYCAIKYYLGAANYKIMGILPYY